MTDKFKGHFDIVGSGTPVLCIPGFGNSNWIFERLAGRLQDRFCLVLPDNRGMGKSAAAWKPYKLHDLATDCLALMDDLGYERFLVIGLSMGGFVAQLLTLQAPRRVAALALLCSTSGGEQFRQVFPSMSKEQVKKIYSLKAKDRVAAALSDKICPMLQSKYPEVYQYILDRRSSEQEKPTQVMLQFAAVHNFMQHSLSLGSIGCPTMIMTGDNDLLVPMINAQMLAAAIPDSTLSVVTDTDHMFFLEKAGEVAEILAGFLAGK